MKKGWQYYLIYGAVALFFIISVVYRIVPEIADDGAFFLRYAENMAKGHFWVWNIGDAPVWGASAPFFPVLVALPIFFGVPPVTALLVTSIVLSVAAFMLVFHTLFKRGYYIASAFFIFFICLDTGLMYFSSSGLECPLTFLIVALMVYCLFEEGTPVWFSGLVAGLLAINKIDLAPISFVFLAYQFWKSDKKNFSGIYVYGVICLAWYSFAWLYFGAPVPNSFLTKALHQDQNLHIIGHSWFVSFVLREGIHKFLFPIFVLGTALLYKQKDFKLLMLYVLIGIHMLAYTAKPPFEPYNWYAMPSVFCLIIICAYALQSSAALFPKKQYRIAFLLIIAITIFGKAIKNEIAGTKILQETTGLYEGDRANAGRWVNLNMPKEYRVFTGWGNPAYFSQRYVYDGSFLNRPFEPDNLVTKYHPEVLIMQGNPGSTPSKPIYGFYSGEGYTTVKTFTSAFEKGNDYYFAVLLRNDLSEATKFKQTGVGKDKSVIAQGL